MCRGLTLWDEEIRADAYVVCNFEDVYKITHILVVNGSYVVLVGHILYELKRTLLEKAIKVYQFQSCLYKAFSPYSISSLATVSSKLVAGVREYTAEFRGSAYCY